MFLQLEAVVTYIDVYFLLFESQFYKHIRQTLTATYGTPKLTQVEDFGDAATLTFYFRKIPIYLRNLPDFGQEWV